MKTKTITIEIELGPVDQQLLIERDRMTDNELPTTNAAYANWSTRFRVINHVLASRIVHAWNNEEKRSKK